MRIAVFLLLLALTQANLVHFGITKNPNKYLWKIPEEWLQHPERIAFPAQYADGIPESGIPELGILESNTPFLNSNDTYILLKVNKKCRCHAFYWIGKFSSTRKRVNAARYFSMMIHELNKNVDVVEFKNFLRETEEAESKIFRLILGLNIILRINKKLYRVMGSKGQFIMEVPLNYEEFDVNNSFVLSTSTVRVWLPRFINNNKKVKAIALGRCMVGLDKRTLEIQSEISNLNFLEFKNKFINEIPDSPLSYAFPTKMFSLQDQTLAHWRNSQLRLLEFVWTDNSVMCIEIYKRPLISTDLKTSNTYILLDYYNSSTLVYLGSVSTYSQTEEALATAETLYQSMMAPDAWQTVKIFRENHKLPIFFQIYFADVIENL